MTFGNGQAQARGKEPVDWAMDLFVHTPIGLAVMAWKRMPEIVGSVPDLVGQAVSKGCATLAEAEERVSEEIRKARMIGQVAVTFGGRQLRREVDARLREARQAAGGVATFIPGAGGAAPNGAGGPSVTATGTPSAPSSPPDPGATPAAAASAAGSSTTAASSSARRSSAADGPPSSSAAPSPSGAAEPPRKRAPAGSRAAKSTGARKAAKPTGARKVAKPASPSKSSVVDPAVTATAADLPIREYDGLSASQVVSRLTGLTPGELQAVRSYEEGSRGRRTILLAIDRLLG
jgi:hypothetical protein